MKNDLFYHAGCFCHAGWGGTGNEATVDVRFVYLDSFPGSTGLEHKHWSRAGRESLVFFLTWAVSRVVRGWRDLCVGVPEDSEQQKEQRQCVSYLYLPDMGWNILHAENSEMNSMQNVLCSDNVGSFPITLYSCEKGYQALPVHMVSRAGKLVCVCVVCACMCVLERMCIS